MRAGHPTRRRRPLLAAVAGTTLAAAWSVMATAAAAPAGVGSAADTVAALERDGYRVVVEQVGARPLDQCSVAAVQRAGDTTQPVSAGDAPTRQTVQLTANC